MSRNNALTIYITMLCWFAVVLLVSSVSESSILSNFVNPVASENYDLLLQDFNTIFKSHIPFLSDILLNYLSSIDFAKSSFWLRLIGILFYGFSFILVGIKDFKEINLAQAIIISFIFTNPILINSIFLSSHAAFWIGLAILFIIELFPKLDDKLKSFLQSFIILFDLSLIPLIFIGPIKNISSNSLDRKKWLALLLGQTIIAFSYLNWQLSKIGQGTGAFFGNYKILEESIYFPIDTSQGILLENLKAIFNGLSSFALPIGVTYDFYIWNLNNFIGFAILLIFVVYLLKSKNSKTMITLFSLMLMMGFISFIRTSVFQDKILSIYRDTINIVRPIDERDIISLVIFVTLLSLNKITNFVTKISFKPLIYGLIFTLGVANLTVKSSNIKDLMTQFHWKKNSFIINSSLVTLKNIQLAGGDKLLTNELLESLNVGVNYFLFENIKMLFLSKHNKDEVKFYTRYLKILQLDDKLHPQFKIDFLIDSGRFDLFAKAKEEISQDLRLEWIRKNYYNSLLDEQYNQLLYQKFFFHGQQLFLLNKFDEALLYFTSALPFATEDFQKDKVNLKLKMIEEKTSETKAKQ